jgi:ADP-specific Phosphofructokinase/Glucokinase conserved region
MEEEEGEPVVANVHLEISSLREFIETFAYQFMNGANAERVSNSKELFYLFYDTLKASSLDQRDELGGHSPVWALRA